MSYFFRVIATLSVDIFMLHKSHELLPTRMTKIAEILERPGKAPNCVIKIANTIMIGIGRAAGGHIARIMSPRQLSSMIFGNFEKGGVENTARFHHVGKALQTNADIVEW